jgi:Flp pilus assembly protein TadG
MRKRDSIGRARYLLFRLKNRGQSALELAIAVPFLAILLLAAADVARWYFFLMEVKNAAKAGAQYGAQNSTSAADLAGMRQAAVNDAANVPGMTATASLYCACPGGSSNFSCNSGTTCADERAYVEVDTAATFHTLFSYPGLPSQLSIQGKSIMRAQ